MKHSSDDLAIFGGAPAFQEALYVGCPNIGDRQRLLTRINDLLDRRRLTNNGPYVQELEQQIANMIGVKHCIATSNGTVALEIASRALGLQGEVIVPSMTFIATVHVLRWQGITPVFCDIDAASHNIDPYRVEEMITPHTTGILGVHVWGRPCHVEALAEIAQRRNLKLLYDAAHAFACSHKGRMIGNFGDAEVFSFHATKFFNTLEGGAVVTNNDELSRKLRLMRNFGFAGYDDVVSIGTNGKMNEISAAMGLTSLESLNKFIDINYRNYQQYQQELKGIPGVKLVTFNEAERCNYQYIVLEVDRDEAGVSRDQLVDILWAENVLARRYFYPGCHQMEPYRLDFPDASLVLPETEKLTKRVLCLPTGTTIDLNQIGQICQIIRFVITHSHSVQQRWTFKGDSS